MPLAMPSPGLEIEAMADGLALARRTGRLATGIDLGRIGHLGDAADLCDAAVRSLGWAQIGYALVGTHAQVARTLCLDGPVVGPLLREAVLDDDRTYKLPHGAIGAGTGLTFLVGRSFPSAQGEALSAENAATACIACRIDLHLVGRRAAGPVPLDAGVATADFGLDLAHVAGPWIQGWRAIDLSAAEASLAIDGNVLARGHGRDVLGDPLAAIAWLARRLAMEGSGLSAGDLVAIGPCTGLSQVLPGQRWQASFEGFAPVSLSLA